MAELTEKTTYTGQFSISPTEKLFGTLILDGARSSLKVFSEKDFQFDEESRNHILGTLDNLTKVSLLECNTPLIPGHVVGEGGRRSFMQVFPHFVAYGRRHFSPIDEKVSSTSFLIDDASTLFYDFDAFGSLIKPNHYVQEIVRANSEKYKRPISVGAYPELLYFTGHHEICTAKTSFGTININHRPIMTFPGPNGFSIRNRIFTDLAFVEPLEFDEVLNYVIVVTQFFGLLVGRPQNITDFQICVASPQSSDYISNMLNVYWSMPPKREETHFASRNPHPADTLIVAAEDKELFSKVTENWLDRQSSWCDARSRFFNSFSKINSIGIDRLIGSA